MPQTDSNFALPIAKSRSLDELVLEYQLELAELDTVSAQQSNELVVSN